MTLALSLAPARSSPALRGLLIGLTAFLTVLDLFAAQAILPALARAYGTSPAAIGVAVNASTIGMAVSGLGVAIFTRHIERRCGILASLLLLAIPTALLALMPPLLVFAALRIAQGLCMAAAFTLTLAHLAESGSAGASAAYITGNVASNLFGRLIAAAVADHLGLPWTFGVFAGLNLAGALLVYLTVPPAPRAPMPMVEVVRSAPWLQQLRDAVLRAAFGIGFCILFAFIGTFTFVNFVLARQPFALGMMSIGFVYFVFAPSVVSTPLAGRLTMQLGIRCSLWAGLGLALGGLPLLLLPSLAAVLLGLVLVGVGTFFAQAVATGFVGRHATIDRASASGLYLAAYFTGGIVGTAVLGQVFDRVGWAACVGGIGVALAGAALLTRRLESPDRTVSITPVASQDWVSSR